MHVLDVRKGNFPIIILPNFGQPTLINFQDYKDKNGNYTKRINFDAFIIANSGQTIQEILEYFHLNIYIQPILKDEGNFNERRGERYPLHLLEIHKIENTDIKTDDLLTTDDCIIRDFSNNLLKIKRVFGKRNEIYNVKMKVRKKKVLEKLLEESKKSCLLCDIIHVPPNTLMEKINYHAIAFFNKEWSNFRFIHSTDFHIARRNDFIAKFFKEKINKKLKKRRIISRSQALYLTTKLKFREGIQEDKLEDLRYSKYNFNYNLRQLIEFVNTQVNYEELDFVLMTGDLIDYLNIARGNYQYTNNFHVFFHILLGLNKGIDKPPYLSDDELINKKEILAPVFLNVGNHDYRKGHYSLNFGKTYQVFGMEKKDIRYYSDIRFFNYFKALYSRDKFLRDYFRLFNPNLNYKIKIGQQYNIIFLDTGHDSIANLHDFLRGSPSSKGLKDEQIDLLRAYIKLCQDEKIIIAMHTPPVSPYLNYFKKRKYKKKFKLDRNIEWADFYEDNLRKYYKKGRLEKLLKLKYQTIMYNWKRFLKICTGSDDKISRKIEMVLCGHTHSLKEFRLKEVKKKESVSINLGFLMLPIYIDIPCKIYSNNYRKIIEEFKNPGELKIWFDINKPFVFQTQAVGPLSIHFRFKPPGFRYITVKDNQLNSLKIYSLHMIDD
ncbi:MAG: metallophosphoesterase [Promethearchaeota archaeon]